MTKSEEAVRATLTEALDDRDVGELNDDYLLRDLDIDSLKWATVVIKLEQELGVDSFAQQTEYTVPNTVGEFVEMYTSIVKTEGD